MPQSVEEISLKITYRMVNQIPPKESCVTVIRVVLLMSSRDAIVSLCYSCCMVVIVQM